MTPALSGFAGRVSDSGEGRWTLAAAVDEGVPAPVLATALFDRFSSRGNDDFANRVLSAMRHEFGGHAEKPRRAVARERYAADAFVFFGATGDLAYKQIFPALYKLVARDGMHVPIVGVA